MATKTSSNQEDRFRDSLLDLLDDDAYGHLARAAWPQFAGDVTAALEGHQSTRRFGVAYTRRLIRGLPARRRDAIAARDGRAGVIAAASAPAKMPATTLFTGASYTEGLELIRSTRVSVEDCVQWVESLSGTKQLKARKALIGKAAGVSHLEGISSLLDAVVAGDVEGIRLRDLPALSTATNGYLRRGVFNWLEAGDAQMSVELCVELLVLGKEVTLDLAPIAAQRGLTPEARAFLLGELDDLDALQLLFGDGDIDSDTVAQVVGGLSDNDVADLAYAADNARLLAAILDFSDPPTSIEARNMYSDTWSDCAGARRLDLAHRIALLERCNAQTIINEYADGSFFGNDRELYRERLLAAALTYVEGEDLWGLGSGTLRGNNTALSTPAYERLLEFGADVAMAGAALDEILEDLANPAYAEFAAVIAKRISDHCGDSAARWQAVLKMAPGWPASFNALLEAVALLV